jgi:hypothetical protein
MPRLGLLGALALALMIAGAAWGAGADDWKAVERERVLAQARPFLAEKPGTVTAVACPRSPGGPHDFYSEGDYWWPDPSKPDGLPYIQRDGETNPANFVEHRRAMVRMSVQVGALAAAYRLTGDEAYAAKAAEHLRAWFVAPETRMNPSLLYGQAIPGKCTGRGVGVIDTVHLAEPALAVLAIKDSRSLGESDRQAVIEWFRQYHQWIRTHPYGQDERKAANNHGTCWVLQAACFALLAGDTAALAEYRRDFRERLLPGQAAEDGSFPRELKRTKPYGYSLFNLDAMCGVCQALSTPEDDLWAFQTPDGRSIRKAAAYLYPYLKDKAAWPYAHDVMYWDEWPVRQPSLLLAGLALGEAKYVDLWRSLSPDLKVEEVVRNMPIRQVMLWVK